MRIAIITDTHWGVRGDSPLFHDYQKKFLDEVFFPTLQDSSITGVLHLGDLVDRRKVLNFNTAERLTNDFLSPLANWAKSSPYHYVGMIVGNHDTFYKDTNRVNAFSTLLKSYPFEWYTNPFELSSMKTLLLPWICDENREVSINAIKNSRQPIALGHLEFSGFEMHRGSISDHGFSMADFSKFDLVGSGHFHHKSHRGNVHYLGAPYEMVWSDYDDPRGFHVLDTESLELKFIQNPNRMFYKILWDGESWSSAPSIEHESEFYNKYIKIIVRAKPNAYLFDQFVTWLEATGAYDIQIIDETVDMKFDLGKVDDLSNEVSTDESHLLAQKFLDSYVDALDITNKDKLKRFLQNLYQEAQMHEV